MTTRKHENRALDVVTSTLASTARGWGGSMEQVSRDFLEDITLDLYDFEACPFCRLVREQVSALQLDVRIFPCPSGGTRWRPKAYELAGGEVTFPFLVDHAHDVRMPESKEIVEYLWKTYGAGKTPPKRTPLTLPTSMMTSALRAGRGQRAKPSKRVPEQMVELYSFESSPFCRLVRETLCEMEIPYVLRSMAKEQLADIGTPGARLNFGEYSPVQGGRRDQMAQKFGKAQMPCLVDPNTQDVVFDSRKIVTYLKDTYDA